MTGADSGQTGWQKAEASLAPDHISGNFKLLFKMKLGDAAKNGSSFTEPLLATRLINAQGFKDIVLWGSSDTLYAVDSELGNLIWKKQFTSSVSSSKSSCPSNLGIVIEPPPVINFNARRRAPGTRPTPEPPPASASARRLGVSPGGGYFGLKGVYVLTGDGMLHEQVLTTGADFAPPVKFLPSAGGSAYGLNILDKKIYTATGRGCGTVPDAEWTIDLSSSDYPVTSYSAQAAHPISLTGPVIAANGTSFLVTGNGKADAAGSPPPNSVVAIGKDMKATDWFTPTAVKDDLAGASPVLVNYKGKELLVAPDKSGGFVLLDTASLGGADHHTPLFQTASFSSPGKHSWDGLAAWQDSSGTTWVYASVGSKSFLPPVGSSPSATLDHGGVIAMKLEDANGKLGLAPAWVSSDMVNPAPPRIANGVVIALAGGDKKNHAILYVLNAATGAQLYTSKDEIPTYTHESGVAIGDSHAFFTDHNNVLYSFGFGLEH